MRILIVGSAGNMGRRYTAVCEYLSHEVIECDIHNAHEIISYPPSVDKCIVATPISDHFFWCLWCARNNIPFLCEKPISKDIHEIQVIREECKKCNVDGRMVCNWKFLVSNIVVDSIKLDYYNTGKDGFWDLIQPVYLSKNLVVKNNSPFYTCSIDDINISQLNFDASYVRMVQGWMEKEDSLWSMDDAINANKKLLEWQKENRYQCQ